MLCLRPLFGSCLCIYLIYINDDVCRENTDDAFWYAQLISLIECAVKRKWASRMLLLAMFRLQFGWSHSAKFWLSYYGYNGTFQNCRKTVCWLPSLKDEQFLCLRNVTPAALHLWIDVVCCTYTFLGDSYLVTWLYLFSSSTYGVLLLEQFLSFAGTDW